jgi:hypothetical protein
MVVCTFHLFGEVHLVVSEMEGSKDVKECLSFSFMSYSLHICFVSILKQRNVKLNSIWMTVWLNVLQCHPYFIAVMEQTDNLKLPYRKVMWQSVQQNAGSLCLVPEVGRLNSQHQ